MVRKMEADKALMLIQLADALEQSYTELESAYQKQDKKKFEEAKAAVVELQGKIDYMLK